MLCIAALCDACNVWFKTECVERVGEFKVIDPLTLDQMRTLIAVVETGSFSAAARKLERVQSAVSQTIQSLEATLGITLFDRSSKTPKLTAAGATILGEAREVLAHIRKLRARAVSIAEGVEPELTLAVDALFPMPYLIQSLAALRVAFPHLPATVFTEELGGAIETLRTGSARLAIHPVLAGSQADLSMEFLTNITLVPVVSAHHPIAQMEGPVGYEDLERQVQLVLTGRSHFALGLRGGIVSEHVWRFADLQTRLDFLLAGFGWCRMPEHTVSAHIAAGRLKQFIITQEEPSVLPFYVIREPGREFGRAGQWLIDNLRAQLNDPNRHD